MPGTSPTIIQPPASHYEFDTDEAGFEEWAGKWRLAWKDQGEGPRTVVVWDHALGHRAEVPIPDGVSYGWWEGDAGWFLANDRRAGRAYCSGNSRQLAPPNSPLDLTAAACSLYRAQRLTGRCGRWVCRSTTVYSRR
jgi:hypothetical protein